MVRIIKIQPITDFINIHPQYSKGLETWIKVVRSSNWIKPQDIIEMFGAKAIDLLGNFKNKATDRVVFDVKGNQVRIIAKYVFHPEQKSSRLYIKWIGTHAEYDKLNNKGLQYTVDLYK